jgi:hypothetical protein
MNTATLEVHGVFLFSDGRTVITGEIDHVRPAVIGRAIATVVLDGKDIGTIRLCGERMPGPGGGPKTRTLETYDPFTWDQHMVSSGKYQMKIEFEIDATS